MSFAKIREEHLNEMRSQDIQERIMARRKKCNLETEAAMNLRQSITATLIPDSKNVNTSFLVPQFDRPVLNFKSPDLEMDQPDGDGIEIDLGKRNKLRIQDSPDEPLDPEDDLIFLDESDPLFNYVGGRPIKLSDHFRLTKQLEAQRRSVSKLHDEADAHITQVLCFMKQDLQVDIHRIGTQGALLAINSLMCFPHSNSQIEAHWVTYFCSPMPASTSCSGPASESKMVSTTRLAVLLSLLASSSDIPPDVQLASLSLLISLTSCKTTSASQELNKQPDLIPCLLSLLDTSPIVEVLDTVLWTIANLLVGNTVACASYLSASGLDIYLSLDTRYRQFRRMLMDQSGNQQRVEINMPTLVTLRSKLQNRLPAQHTHPGIGFEGWPIMQQKSIIMDTDAQAVERIESRLIEFMPYLFREFSELRKISRENKLKHIRIFDPQFELEVGNKMLCWLAVQTNQLVDQLTATRITNHNTRSQLEEYLIALRQWMESFKRASELGLELSLVLPLWRHAGIDWRIDQTLLKLIEYERSISQESNNLKLEACFILGCLSSVDEDTLEQLGLMNVARYLDRGLFRLYSEDLRIYLWKQAPSNLDSMLAQEQVFTISNLVNTSSKLAFRVYEHNKVLFQQIGDCLYRSSTYKKSSFIYYCLRLIINLLTSVSDEDWKPSKMECEEKPTAKYDTSVLSVGEKFQDIINTFGGFIAWILQSLDEDIEDNICRHLLLILQLILKVDRQHETYYEIELGFCRECLLHDSIENLEKMGLHRNEEIRALATDIMEEFFETFDEDY